MQSVLVALCFPLAFAFAPAPPAQEAKPSVARVSFAEMFPAPREGLTIEADRPNSDAATSVSQLLDDFTRVTGVAVQMNKDTQNVAQRSSLGLNRSIQVPASEVYRIVETLLRANDFVAVHLSDVEPRIWRVQSVAVASGRGGNLRADPLVVDEGALASWADHPATLITTTISLPNTDVRTLSNSMRTMFTDANTQSIIPVGDGSLLITGFAREVNVLVGMLHRIDTLSKGNATNEVRARGAVQPGQERK